MDEREQDAAARVVRSGWLTQGPEVARFESAFAGFVGAPHACAVSSCTSALHLALLSAGVREDDHVLVPSHSFIATANAVRLCRAIPIFIDIDPATFNLDPQKLEDSITPRTRAILCVHQMGMPCDMDALLDISSRRNLPLIEDAACAAGSSILHNGQWQPIGRPLGAVACFSFHPRKVITTGEGGMLTTADTASDRDFRLWRQHAMSVPDTVRHGSSDVVFESYVSHGFNYRMTDLAAAVGSVQLSRLPDLVAARRSLAANYRALLSGSPITLPHEPAYARTNWQSFCVRLPHAADQRSVMQFMLHRGIATRRGIMCSHLELAWPTGSWLSGAAGLAHSEAAQRECILLPLFPGLSSDDQQLVARTLLEALAA